ncbi:MAG: hypothetical protein ACR2KT_11865 [Methylocella sp.]
MSAVLLRFRTPLEDGGRRGFAAYRRPRGAFWRDGPKDGDAFRAYVEQVLVAALAPGDAIASASPQAAWRAASHR